MYQRILVAVDGSPTGTLGLDEALALAKLTGAKLKLVHVLDQVSLMAAMGPYAVFSAETVEMLQKGARDILARAKARATKALPSVEAELIDTMSAGVADSIIGVAAKWRADLVVLGTHGRRGVNRLVMGSDAEQIARRAPVPVLLVRARAKAGARAAAPRRVAPAKVAKASKARKRA